MTRDPAPPSYRRTLMLLAVLAGTVCGSLIHVLRVQAEAERIFACLDGTDDVTATVQKRGADGKRRNVALTADEIAALWEIEGESLWAGYDAGGWALPPDFAQMRFEKTFVRGEKAGVEFWAMFRFSEAFSMATVYENTTRFADANGEHAGYHPCDSWRIDGETARAALGL